MGDPTDRGLPFELDPSWRSTFLALELRDDRNLFLPPDFVLPSLADGGNHDALEYDLELELPDISNADCSDLRVLDEIDSGILSSENVATSPKLDSSDCHSDIWSLDLCDPTDDLAPRMRTWEAFDKKTVLNAQHTAYLSEAGPAAFDAALASQQPKESRGILHQDVSLRALSNLALGRSSIFFQWDEPKQSFVPTLEGVPTAGLSLQCSQSFAAQAMDYGAAYRTLQAFGESPGQAVGSSATLTALRRTVASVLEAIEAYISHRLQALLSPLQLQDTLERPRQLLEVLQSLTSFIYDGISEEEAVSAVADRVHALVETGSAVALLLRVILVRVSEPWLSALAQDLGLSSNASPALHDTTSDAFDGTEAVNLSVTENAGIDSERMSVLSPEDRKLIMETKASLTILRKHFPDHDLRLAASSGQDGAQLGNTVSRNSRTSDPHPKPLPRHSAALTMISEDAMTERALGSEMQDAAWSDHVAQMEYYEAMDARISRLPAGLPLAPTDPLRAATIDVLNVGTAPDLGHSYAFESALSLQPFDELRPLVQAQSSRLNSMLLRYMFQTCHLRKHLDLQHAFHLFGNGNFVSRLSTALFSPETQSAERKRGTIPTSETMGLRLGVREGQLWPPASSELRLTLMGVLSETYHTTAAQSMPSSTKQVELPGGLSFAIRELPDAEIDRVMDANSIYALDFLRLQYTAPAPLDAVITRIAMQKYDDTFRFLLRLMRILDTTTRLHRTHATGGDGKSGMASLFAAEAHHFVSSLMSYVVDIGIGAPWRVFQHALDGIEQALAVRGSNTTGRVDASIGIDSLRELHNHCLDTMRTRLYLKRKQEGLRKAIDAVLVGILEAASAHETAKGRDQEHSKGKIARFRAAVSALVSKLKDVVDRPAKSRSTSDSTEDETEMARLLLAKLNWNGFYGAPARLAS
ncbi:hypothetical protein LTR36_004141 [Oleoguttula mirabilis]|uniref:Spindle pole body component n=1 Tax=Oleoguttula mirabilis TaxID=1507867 RepID=A0AAV9JI60_9PEZI|nr:hypothetical protein LTR36_004141 [Oleoguttula mirabilis]